MSDFVSLGDLEDAVRHMADVQSELDRHPQAEVWRLINRGIKQFHNEVIKAQGQGIFQTDTFFITTGGTEMYPLHAEILQVKKVWTFFNGREYVLDAYEEGETDGMVDNIPFDSAGYAPMGYRIIGDNMSLRPTTSDTLTINIRYIATAVKLTASFDTIDAIEGFDEYVVAWAARRIAFKDNRQDLVALCSQDIGMTLENLRAVVRARNAASPKRIIDKRGSTMGRHYGRAWRGWWRV